MTGDYRDYLIGFLYGKLRVHLKQHSSESRGFYDRDSLSDEQKKDNILFYEVENAMQPYLTKLNPPPEMKDRRRHHD